MPQRTAQRFDLGGKQRIERLAPFHRLDRFDVGEGVGKISDEIRGAGGLLQTRLARNPHQHVERQQHGGPNGGANEGQFP